jgi:hypothetical protein
MFGRDGWYGSQIGYSGYRVCRNSTSLTVSSFFLSLSSSMVIWLSWSLNIFNVDF